MPEKMTRKATSKSVEGRYAQFSIGKKNKKIKQLRGFAGGILKE